MTEIQKITGRGHAVTIDGGWRDVSLAFVRRFVDPRPAREMAMAGARGE